MRNLNGIFLVILGFMVACDADDDDIQPVNGDQAENEIRMSNTSFLPVNLELSAGSIVIWANNSDVDHTVTSNDGLFDEYLETGDQFEYTFADPGTYNYVCKLHQGMTGTITILSENDEEGNGSTEVNEIGMSSTSFLPETLTVSSGTTVSWLNNSTVDHTVTSNTALFDEYLEPDGRFEYTFTEAGTYNYVCNLHPGMTGTIIVEPAGE
jgi:plastocyanin